MVHVLPLNDDREHERSTTCWCHPVVDWSAAQALVTHNSADCREAVERLLGESVSEDKPWAVEESD